MSIAQRLGCDAVLFGCLGKRSHGDGQFDCPVTLGIEHGGSAWGTYRRCLGRCGGLAVDGRIAELYDRLQRSRQLAPCPDSLLIQRAAGDARGPTIRMIGVRASLGF